MNMNYMILSALHHYSQEDGPYKARAKIVYEELRKNIIGYSVIHWWFLLNLFSVLFSWFHFVWQECRKELLPDWILMGAV